MIDSGLSVDTDEPPELAWNQPPKVAGYTGLAFIVKLGYVLKLTFWAIELVTGPAATG